MPYEINKENNYIYQQIIYIYTYLLLTKDGLLHQISLFTNGLHVLFIV